MGEIHERTCKRWNGTIPSSPSFIRISSRPREEESVTALPRLQPEGCAVGREEEEGEMIRGRGLDSDKPGRLVD